MKCQSSFLAGRALVPFSALLLVNEDALKKTLLASAEETAFISAPQCGSHRQTDRQHLESSAMSRHINEVAKWQGLFVCGAKTASGACFSKDPLNYRARYLPGLSRNRPQVRNAHICGWQVGQNHLFITVNGVTESERLRRECFLR